MPRSVWATSGQSGYAGFCHDSMHAGPLAPVEFDCGAEEAEDAAAEEAAAEEEEAAAEESVVLTVLLSIKSGSKDAG